MKKLILSVLSLLLVCSVGVFASGQGEGEAAGAAAAANVINIETGEACAFGTAQEFEKATGIKLTYSEAPTLKKMVDAGKLPPLDQRLAKEPLVLLPLSEVKQVGTYQPGPIYQSNKGAVPPAHSNHQMGLANAFSFRAVYPAVFKSYRSENEGREWIFEIRGGLKWSDGEPFTVEDVLFGYEDYMTDKDMNPTTFENLKQRNAPPGKFVVVDDRTVKYVFTWPYIMEENIFDLMAFASYFPKHYMKQFHPRYQDAATLEKMIKDGGFNSWTELYNERMDPWSQERFTEKPVLAPWQCVQPLPNEVVIFQRNPYYWAVDVEGQQLPYIDEVRIEQTADLEVAKLKAINGDLDWFSNAGVELFPTAKEAGNRDGKIAVTRWGHSATNGGTIEFNMTQPDPVLRSIFQDKNFRFGISYAINREAIIQLNYFGLVGAQQSCWSETSPMYDAELCNTALDYDPDKANRLLDTAGLDKKDADGMRLRPDGKKMEINILTFEGDHTKDVEIIISNLKKVGLSANFRVLDWGALHKIRNANELECVYDPYNWGTNEGLFYQAASLGVPYKRGYWGGLWTNWFMSDGEDGERPADPVVEAIEAYWIVLTNVDMAIRQKAMKTITQIAAENLWTIGTIQHPGNTIIYNAKLRNIPTSFEAHFRTDYGRMQTWFFAD